MERKEKRSLSSLEIMGICKFLEEQEFSEEKEEAESSGRRTYISVDEDSEGCRAYYGCMEDGPQQGLSSGTIIHTITVEYVTICATETEDGLDGIYMPQDSDFALPNDAELISKLEEYIEEYWDYSSFDDYGCDAEEQFENDWSPAELIQEIEEQLAYETYIKIDETIYPVEDDVESFIAEYCECNACETPDYITLSARDAAEELANNVEFSC